MMRLLVIHPFLLALWPCVFVFAQNQDQLAFTQLWPSVLILLAIVSVLFLLLTWILKDVRRVGIILSLFFFLFFSFGQFVQLVRAEPQVLLVVYVVVFALGSAAAVFLRRGLDPLTQTLNMVASILVLISLVSIAINAYNWHGTLGQGPGFEPIEVVAKAPDDGDALPDIYYIIVDGYARADILKELYAYDNTEFLRFLERRGFYVADGSRSNYAQTALSLASSLNLNYLDGPIAEIGTDAKDRGVLKDLIRKSATLEFLRARGYRIVSFPTGYALTTLADAEIVTQEVWNLNEFEIGLLAATPFPWLRSYSEIKPQTLHARRITNTLNHLAETADVDSPHFVFAHVVCPHPPFVFDEDGNRIESSRPQFLQDGSHYFESGRTPEEYRTGYVKQVKFINERIRGVIEDILSRSSRPPIIVLQADHGSGLRLDWDDPESTYFKERLSILNAYLLPGDVSGDLYPNITPVNTFRLIFRHYFGADLEPLEDRSYFSTWSLPYDFVDVTAQIQLEQAEP